MSETDVRIFNQDKYVAHYTSINATLSILEDREIKLSHKSNTNDLYESNENWFFNEAYAGDMTNDEMFECMNIKERIENKLNKHIQLFSTIGYQDKRTLYNRPRAWAQYGDNHRGVCLIFNKKKLVEKFNNDNIIKSLYGKITYIDWIDIIQAQGCYQAPNNIQKLTKLLNTPELLFEEVNKNDSLKKRLFRKDIDWENENEYRFLAFSKKIDNICIDYKDALEAIVLGSNVNKRLRNCFVYDDVKKYHIEYDEYNEYKYFQFK